MTEDIFYLNKMKKYILYGVGGNALKLVKLFQSTQYELLGFIDKRAALLQEVEGKKVWSLETIEEMREGADDIVIIITIKNVFAHTEIATCLAERGFSQIIYKPLAILQGAEDVELERISKTHDTFIIDVKMPEEICLKKFLPCTKYIYKDRLIIKALDNKLLVWVPVELIYNYQTNDAYENINMSTLFPLLGLYRLFLGEKTTDSESDILEDFYSYCAAWAFSNNLQIDDELKRNWVESRRAAFEQMQKISEYDFDFFFRNAPEVTYGNKGKFYVKHSGRNRITFLIAKGYRLIPLFMARSDYEKWINEECFKKLKEQIEKDNVYKLPVIFPHPLMRDIISDFSDYYRLVCCPVMYEIIAYLYRKSMRDEAGNKYVDLRMVKQKKAEIHIGCCIQDEGAMSRFFDANDMDTCRINGEKGSIYAKLIDALFYQRIKEIDVGEVEKCELNLLVIDESFNLKYLNRLIQNKKIAIIRFGKSNHVFDRVMVENQYRIEKEIGKLLYNNGIYLIKIYLNQGGEQYDRK